MRELNKKFLAISSLNQNLNHDQQINKIDIDEVDAPYFTKWKQCAKKRLKLMILNRMDHLKVIQDLDIVEKLKDLDTRIR